ncbi:hypothetical protein LOK49_LG10G02808 [Camellia lanceoleosa]|uniref:Uncharacterized protein n=1 Tax=Camellia lanceoleosa TaxID=1840588 RepID=A0ACC0GAH3_9ERIC|nr:hypothetical protein LOK49_LG10G02808 [Camellia lanceoleosa]
MGPTRLCKLSRHRFRLALISVRHDPVNCFLQRSDMTP